MAQQEPDNPADEVSHAGRSSTTQALAEANEKRKVKEER
jgi:hypothetical protein